MKSMKNSQLEGAYNPSNPTFFAHHKNAGTTPGELAGLLKSFKHLNTIYIPIIVCWKSMG
ncbi:MAG: hypothetical protein ACE5R6_11070 [Candidatus Heimdallarchaeota archaeon]